MTETEAVYTPTPRAETPFQALSRLTAEADTLEEAKQQLIARIEANYAERISIAKSIYANKLTDTDLALHPTFRLKPHRKIDIAKLKTAHPGLYARASPHVSDNVAMDILEGINGGMDRVQELLREADPDTFAEKATIRVTDLDKAASSVELTQLAEEGILKTEMTPVGDPRTCSANFAKALAEGKKKKQTRPLPEPEDEE